MTSGIHRALALALLVLPASAQAHSPIEGIGDFYNGVLHPLIVPEHVLTLLASGLLLGQQRTSVVRTSLWTFLVVIVAGLAQVALNRGYSVEAYLPALAAIIGLLVTFRLKLPGAIFPVLLALVGLLVSTDSDPEGLARSARLAFLPGAGLGMLVTVLYASALSHFCMRREWPSIGVRIAGSWVAASAMLVLSLSFAGVFTAAG